MLCEKRKGLQNFYFVMTALNKFRNTYNSKMDRNETDMLINNGVGYRSPESSQSTEDIKTPDGAITIPVKKQKKGSRWRCSGVITKLGERIVSYTTEDGIKYRKGDCVYLENSNIDQPFYVCGIKEFRLTKKDTLVATVKWYFRSSEVPHNVYQHLVHDRHSESKYITSSPIECDNIHFMVVTVKTNSVEVYYHCTDIWCQTNSVEVYYHCTDIWCRTNSVEVYYHCTDIWN
ncbi:RERE [Mytilus coruscus]|uniref:RERE n=1 Tax=Mytilus coruscus TaxID=42192 RepID=A0A6J7ZWY3_MYTCO|nr:RERE [Mytilus coruscus]